MENYERQILVNGNIYGIAQKDNMLVAVGQIKLRNHREKVKPRKGNP